jgi:hypothetical protein
MQKMCMNRKKFFGNITSTTHHYLDSCDHITAAPPSPLHTVHRLYVKQRTKQFYFFASFNLKRDEEGKENVMAQNAAELYPFGGTVRCNLFYEGKQPNSKQKKYHVTRFL